MAGGFEFYKEQMDFSVVETLSGPHIDLSDPANPILPEFVLKSVYDFAIVNKANINGSNTVGGTWYQDAILSDLFPSYKQVIRVLGGQMAIEYGNVELDVHRFVVTSVNGLKIKVGSAEYTVFHTGNFNPDSKANTDGSNATGALAATIGNNHNHTNKSVLDSITPQDLIDWDNASAQSHNALTLGANAAGMNLNTSTQVLQLANGYQLPTTIKLSEYDEAFLMRHSHTNKALLDSYNQTNANIADAVSLRHSHINKAILDAITAAYTTADKNTLDALAGIQLEADQANALIHIKDGNGNVLSTLNVAFLNNEGTTFVYNPTTNTLDLINDYGQTLSSIPVSSFVTNLVNNANWNGTTPSRLDFKDNAGTVLFSIDYTIANIGGLQNALDGKLVAGDNISLLNNDVGYITSGTLANYVNKAGDTMTGALVNETGWYYGEAPSSVNPKSHAIRLGVSGRNYMDFYEYGGVWNFYRSQGLTDDLLFNLQFGNSTLNSTLSIPNATASNHAVAFGQLSNYALLSQVYTQSQALALFVGLNGVQTIADTKTFTSSPIVPNAMLNGHAVNLGQLLSYGYASQSQLANYALANGSNTVGGIWNINKINAPNLITSNKQIFSEGGTVVYFGNPQLDNVFLESTGDLIHLKNGVFGYIWTQHNFNPANYALLSQVYTQAQALALFVGKTGVETIQDTKTFTHSPIVPNGTLSGHTVNLGQMQSYVMGLGYQTAAQVNTIVNNAISAIPAPGNGSVILQGIGSLTGTATFSMNQANNTVGSFDLTTTTKNEIAAGATAGVQIVGLFGDCQNYFDHVDVSAGGTIDVNETFYNLLDPHGAQPTVNVTNHHVHGARLILHSYNGVGSVKYIGEFVIEDSHYSEVNPENGQKMEFTWNEESQVWIYVLPN